MRIAIPSNGHKGMDEEVCPHFGQAMTFTVYNTETKEIEIIENSSSHRGGSGLPPDLLADNGVDALICGGVGRKAIELFAQRGIKVYTGAIDTVRDTLELLDVGLLKEATLEDGCAGHHHH